MQYELLDSGNLQKLEKFGDYLLVRPCSQAVWKPTAPQSLWESASATFTREEGNRWIYHKKLPKEWTTELAHVRFKIAPTDFGHLGIFPEHSYLWDFMRPHLEKRKGAKLLNLFAYSGGASLVAASCGAHVCHLDASKGMVAWARENAALNNLQGAPIRWIIDDVSKFLAREQKRGVRYDAIILDPPSFGRGNQGEIFKIDRDLHNLLSSCTALLSDDPLFLILSTHTPGMTPLVMGHLLGQWMGKEGKIETGEMCIHGKTLPLPCGSFARWYRDV